VNGNLRYEHADYGVWVVARSSLSHPTSRTRYPVCCSAGLLLAPVITCRLSLITDCGVSAQRFNKLQSWLIRGVAGLFIGAGKRVAVASRNHIAVISVAIIQFLALSFFLTSCLTHQLLGKRNIWVEPPTPPHSKCWPVAPSAMVEITGPQESCLSPPVSCSSVPVENSTPFLHAMNSSGARLRLLQDGFQPYNGGVFWKTQQVCCALLPITTESISSPMLGL